MSAIKKEDFDQGNLSEIRQCCITKNVANCAGCNYYICEALAGFIKLAREAGNGLEIYRE